MVSILLRRQEFMHAEKRPESARGRDAKDAQGRANLRVAARAGDPSESVGCD
jgi:hypothetical protein